MAGKDEQRPLHILFFPYPAPGHLIPIADMAALFATRGVKCTILTTPANAAIIRPAVDRANDARRGAADAVPPPAIQISVVPFPDVGLPLGVENATGLTGAADRDKFFHAIQRFREPFDRFFAGERPDAVVADSHFQWSVDAAAEHGVPRLAFLGTSMFARACTDSMMRNNPLESCPDAVVSLPGLPHRVEMSRGQMVDPLKRPEVWAFFQRVIAEDQRSYGEVFNSFHELEPDYVEHYRTTLGRRVWLVGPVAPAGGDMGASATKGDTSELSSDGAGCLRWLDTKPAGSVVYVSFGTLSSFTPAELRELARGLDLSGKNFVWVISHAGGGADAADTDALPEWMPEGFAELTAPPGGRGFIIRGWAPQTRILSHPALGAFLTHCGWNSTLEAVSAGVPMVTWPRFGDQFFNEKLVVEVLRIGASVGACDYASFMETHHGVVRAEVVAGSIGTVMGDGEEGEAIKSKARELGVKARRAVGDAGSSYGDVGRLMEELVARRRNNVT